MSAAARFKSPTEKLCEGKTKTPAEARRVPVSKPTKILVGKREKKALLHLALATVTLNTPNAFPRYCEDLRGANTKLEDVLSWLE